MSILGPMVFEELVNAARLFERGTSLIDAGPEIGVVAAFDGVGRECSGLARKFAKAWLGLRAQLDQLLELVSLWRFHIVSDQPSLDGFFGGLLTMEASTCQSDSCVDQSFGGGEFFLGHFQPLL